MEFPGRNRDFVAQRTITQYFDHTRVRVFVDLNNDLIIYTSIAAHLASDDLIMRSQFITIQYIVIGHLLNFDGRVCMGIHRDIVNE
ncbi:hypothetical protein D3C81_2094990 [compost metagenome]